MRSSDIVNKIILAIYSDFTKEEHPSKIYTIEKLHMIIVHSIVLMPKSIANYLRLMHTSGYFATSGLGLELTPIFFEKVAELTTPKEKPEEQKTLKPEPKPKTEDEIRAEKTDETGLYKY